MTTDTIKTSITLDELSLRRWDALARHYRMPNATVLWHIINLTDVDSAVAGDWRKYIASRIYKPSGQLRSIRLDLRAKTRQSLANIKRGIQSDASLSQIVREILDFWAQFTTEEIAC